MICKHLGPETGNIVGCETCRGHVSLKLLVCDVFSVCTTSKAANGVACCNGHNTAKGYEPCLRYEPRILPLA